MSDKLSTIREALVSVMMDAADMTYHYGFGPVSVVAARMVEQCQRALRAVEALEKDQGE